MSKALPGPARGINVKWQCVSPGSYRADRGLVSCWARVSTKCFWKHTAPTHQLRAFYQHFTHAVSDEGHKVKRITQQPGFIVHISILSLGLFSSFQLLLEHRTAHLEEQLAVSRNLRENKNQVHKAEMKVLKPYHSLLPKCGIEPIHFKGMIWFNNKSLCFLLSSVSLS